MTDEAFSLWKKIFIVLKYILKDYGIVYLYVVISFF